MNRIFTKADAIVALRPGAEFVVRGDDLEWLDTEQVQPTASEIQNKLDELNAAQPMVELREKRDEKLAEVDWITFRAYSQGVPVPAEWAEYQQALRDITNTYNNLDDVVWPIKPE